MLNLVVGENSYARDQAVGALLRGFEGEVEKRDGAELTVADLPEILSGVTLFSSSRMVIVSELSANKTVWTALAGFADKFTEGNQVVLVESKPDKRTKTYKELAKVARVVEAPLLTVRDEHKVVQWLVDEARTLGLELSRQQAGQMTRRALSAGERPGVAVIDQGILAQALEVLAIKGEVSGDDIASVLPPTPQENVFEIFEAALQRDLVKVDRIVAALSVHEEAYMVMGLLAGQVYNLAVLVAASKPSAEVAKDMGAHPFVMSKLAGYAGKMSRGELETIVEHAALADERLKTTAADPWTVVWEFLAKVAQR